MLETKNLVKIYRPKKGVPVRALDGVSLKFPDRGMIFLLGKSGSGKSTLLNVLGGLDRYDSGEILIKGVSSKNFRQQDFDIYRNTYVGFIFQEYNVLEEFTVGANIALAIELQNRKATDEEINRILKEVDLEGYGDRKPNELSGGQKQRVAIARALIKNPEIIMADEPTGALDSATGRAVFDTLKKLSSNHLVIVVSHDRDFAVQYADRIIELADGHVVSDLEYEDATPPSAMVDEESKGEELSQLRFEEGEIFIPRRYRLSEADREAINCYLAKIEESGQQARLVSEQKKEAGRKEAPGVKGKTSRPTDVSSIPNGDPSTFRKIKSKLPMKCAFRIGASGLTHKKVRLCITIFLSCVAFVLFGLADTFGSYEHIRTCARSIKDTGIDYATVKKSVRLEMDDYSYYSSTFLTDADLETLQKETGVAFYGIYTPRSSLAIEDQFKNPAKEDMVVDSRYQLSAKCLSGFSETDDATFQQLGYPLVAGKLPEGDRNELAISQYLCESFIQYGYYDLQNGKIDGDGNRIYETVKSADDMIGKVLYLCGEPYTVSGVFDSHLDVDRYVNLLTENQTGDSTATGILLNYAIMMEFSGAQQNSFAQVALVGKGFISRFKNEKDTYYLNDMGNIFVEMDGDSTSWADQIKSTDEIPVNCEVIWKNADAEPMQRNEYLISLDMFGAEINWDDVYSTDDESQQMASLKEQVKKLLNERSFRLNVEWYDTGYVADEYVIAGVVLPKTLSASGDFPLTLYCDTLNQELVSRQSSVAYGIASGRMPESEDAIRRLVSVCYQENEVKYPLQNPVTFELDTVHDVFQVLSKVFLYIGIGFALFASMMLANFIGTSIAYKKQEIGILRAIGARSNDVFRIFFAESFLIAMINFVLSSVGVALLTFWINVSIRNNVGILITVLRFGIRQCLLLFIVSIAVAALASFLPVRKIAAKRPIDAIRNR